MMRSRYILALKAQKCYRNVRLINPTGTFYIAFKVRHPLSAACHSAWREMSCAVPFGTRSEIRRCRMWTLKLNEQTRTETGNDRPITGAPGRP